MSDEIIVLMLVLAVICVMLATQPAPPPRSRRSRLPDRSKGPHPATETERDNGAAADDGPHDRRFSALHLPAPAVTATPSRPADDPPRQPGSQTSDSTAAAFALWPANGNTLR